MQNPPVEAEQKEDLHSVRKTRHREAWLYFVSPIAVKQCQYNNCLRFSAIDSDGQLISHLVSIPVAVTRPRVDRIFQCSSFPNEACSIWSVLSSISLNIELRPDVLGSVLLQLLQCLQFEKHPSSPSNLRIKRESWRNIYIILYIKFTGGKSDLLWYSTAGDSIFSYAGHRKVSGDHKTKGNEQYKKCFECYRRTCY